MAAVMPFGPKPRPLKERFLEKIEVAKSGCHLWKGCTNGIGYGMILSGKKKELAHRIAWELFRGEIPPGKVILHTCDVPSCVNPEHLNLGTQRDNMRDRAEKHRDNPSQAVLTEEQVLEIVERYKGDETQPDLAKEFGVSQTAISSIIRGVTWQYVTAGVLPRKLKRNYRERSLSDHQIRSIRRSYAKGTTQQDLADMYDVSKALIQQIVTLRAWKHVT